MHSTYRKRGKSRRHFLFWMFPLLFALGLSACLWVALDRLLEKALPVMDRLLSLAVIL